MRFAIRFLLSSLVALSAHRAHAYDARPFCDSKAIVQAEGKVLDVQRRIGVDFSAEPAKNLPPSVRNPDDLRELPPVFEERFLLLEKALFGRNGVLKFAGSANNKEGFASMEPGYGVVIDASFAETLLKERPNDTGLIDLVLSHELGHYVQNSYTEVDHTNLLVKEVKDSSRFLAPPAVQAKLRRILSRKDDISRDLNASAASHAEVTWIGLAIMKQARAPIRSDAVHQLKRIRDFFTRDPSIIGFSQEQFLDFNTVEFTLVDCALEAMGIR